jgi:spore maturation protein SpmA
LTWLFWKDSKIDFIVLFGANVLFFLVSVMAFRMQYTAMQNSNPNVFIRKVMSTMLLKMGIALVAVMAYVLICGKSFNKPAVYISMLIYLVYLVVEVGLVMKLNKRKNA